MEINNIVMTISTPDGYKIYLDVQQEYQYPDTTVKMKVDRILEFIKQDSESYYR